MEHFFTSFGAGVIFVYIRPKTLLRVPQKRSCVKQIISVSDMLLQQPHLSVILTNVKTIGPGPR